MGANFEIVFLEEAKAFLSTVDSKAGVKILYNMDKSRYSKDPELFKKVSDYIWEFRTEYGGLQYRMLAFWDKRDKTHTLVVATNGMVKKKDRIPLKEINKAERLRKEYFNI
ncbi:MAG: type II toxin-antitoxin system RelE/ParE family toxin [Bacteroidetes bacterium]|nr:type II toxin-antitoxin system RelE/ParE family toxin [Bacteroidota bacterium]